MTPDDGPQRIGARLDKELFADMTPTAAAPQVLPDDAAKIKALYILKALLAAGLKAPYGFDLDEAASLWASRLAPFGLNVLEAAVQEWIGMPGNEFPTVGDVETVARAITIERRAQSPEERARAARTCPTCEGVHWVRVKDRAPQTGLLLPTTHLRPCPDCPEMSVRSELYDRGHFDAEHQDKGGCPKCWPYMPSQRHRLRAAKARA
jgi:hypothetical protein